MKLRRIALKGKVRNQKNLYMSHSAGLARDFWEARRWEESPKHYNQVSLVTSVHLVRQLLPASHRQRLLSTSVSFHLLVHFMYRPCMTKSSGDCMSCPPPEVLEFSLLHCCTMLGITSLPNTEGLQKSSTLTITNLHICWENLLQHRHNRNSFCMQWERRLWLDVFPKTVCPLSNR